MDAPLSGPFRRYAAMLYDSLLLGCVLFAAGGIAVALNGGAAYEPYDPVFGTGLAAVAYLYFAWPWTHGGRTLGMACWRLVLRRADGQPPTWRDALLRFFAALLAWLPCGLGHLWALVDRQGLALHDYLSRTRLVVTPTPATGAR